MKRFVFGGINLSVPDHCLAQQCRCKGPALNFGPGDEPVPTRRADRIPHDYSAPNSVCKCVCVRALVRVGGCRWMGVGGCGCGRVVVGWCIEGKANALKTKIDRNSWRKTHYLPACTLFFANSVFVRVCVRACRCGVWVGVRVGVFKAKRMRSHLRQIEIHGGNAYCAGMHSHGANELAHTLADILRLGEGIIRMNMTI